MILHPTPFDFPSELQAILSTPPCGDLNERLATQANQEGLGNSYVGQVGRRSVSRSTPKQSLSSRARDRLEASFRRGCAPLVILQQAARNVVANLEGCRRQREVDEATGIGTPRRSHLQHIHAGPGCGWDGPCRSVTRVSRRLGSGHPSQGRVGGGGGSSSASSPSSTRARGKAKLACSVENPQSPHINVMR